MKPNALQTSLIKKIESSPVDLVVGQKERLALELGADLALSRDLSGWWGAYIIRVILHSLNIDEHRIFSFRPEHKLNQYLIFQHYFRDQMPTSYGLKRLLKENGIDYFRKKIREHFFIKAALGFGSRNKGNFDRTTEFRQIYEAINNSDEPEEEWILQKKIKLQKEFRIHTFNQEVIYGLTFRTMGLSEPDDFKKPEAYLQKVLERLPKQLTEGTLIGWDIGCIQHGKYRIIEANFTGYHPQYRSGFQTTGYVDDPSFGAIVSAWLNTYFDHRYSVKVDRLQAGFGSEIQFLREFTYYSSIFNRVQIDTLIGAGGTVNSAIIYLGRNSDMLLIKVIRYMKAANFARSFYIITEVNLAEDIKRIMPEIKFIILAEESLFSFEDHAVNNKLPYKRRHSLYSDQAVKLLREESYIII
jgi:hypothetical protein